jgi:hypothetical protein
MRARVSFLGSTGSLLTQVYQVDIMSSCAQGARPIDRRDDEMMGQRERDALDRHITGNYGEDQFADDLWAGVNEVRLCGKEHEGTCDAEVAYDAWLEMMTAIDEGRATQLTHCYLCEPDHRKRMEKDAGPLRGIARTKTVMQNFDPTEAVQVIPCGHWLI